MSHRQKLSTTIGSDTYAYLHRLVDSGKATSVGEAVDRAVRLARRVDARLRLARATSEYFQRLPAAAEREEGNLADSLSRASSEMDFDQP